MFDQDKGIIGIFLVYTFNSKNIYVSLCKFKSDSRTSQQKYWESKQKHINAFIFVVQVMWDDIIGEPEGLRSVDCAWNCSYKCFKGTKNCCYILLTILFAPCFAFCSALNFACLAFQVTKTERFEDIYKSS